MEFPFGPGHHHEHHHSRGDDEDERNRSPPHFPSPADGLEPFHPPPGVHHVSHQPGAEFASPPPLSEPPPPPFFDASTPPRPSPFVDDTFHDSRHERPYGREEGCHRSGYSDNASHEGEDGSLNRQPTVRVFTKAEENYSLSIRDGKVILARQDPNDEYQHWIKDLRYSTKVKDEESFPAFALINKATAEAIKHSFGATHSFPEPKIVCNDPIPDSFLRTVVHNENEAYEQYCAYAHHIGFSVRKDHSSFWPNSKKIKTKDFICGKAGYKREPKFNSIVKFKRADTRTGCLAMIRYAVDVEGNWSVKKFIESHNHPLAESGDKHLLRSNGKISEINAKKDIYNSFRYRHLEKTQMLSSSSSDLIFHTHVQKLACQIIAKAEGNEQAENYVLESFKKLSVDIDDILNGRGPQSKQKSNKKKILNKEHNLNDPTKMRPKGISNSRLKEYWEKNKRIKRNEKEACSSQDPVPPCDPNLFAMSDCLSQHRIKDLSYSTKVKDEESFPAFALINKATGEAIKHSFGRTHPFPEPKIICNDPIPDSFLRTVVHNENEAYEQYCAYAHHIGFTVRKDHSSFWPNSKKIKTKDFICGKAGYKREPKFNNTVKFKRADTRTGCLAMIRYAVDVEDNWSVKKFIESHNHPLAKPGDKHLLRSNRKISEINAKRDIYNSSRYRHLEKTQMLSSSSSDLIFSTHIQKLAYQIISKAAGNEQAENYVLESFKKLSVDIDDILNGREPQSKQKSNKKNILNKERNLNDPTTMQPKGISNSRLKEYWEKNKRIKRNEKEACSSQDPVLPCDPNLFAMSDCLSQVRLVPYNPNLLDESVLWTESRDLGDGFRCIRMVNNISLNFDAFNGDEQHGGVHDGTIIVLWEWLEGKNQRWKIVPY